jgi:2-C-methyl-D-erythritol 4-phosphate cytidylyltransferase
MNIALLTAAGASTRMNQDIPKQFLHVNNKPIIMYTMEVFEKHPNIDAIIVVCLEGWHDILKAYAKQFGISKLRWVVSGGKTAQESIKNGLLKLKQHCEAEDVVIIHAGNRPMVSKDIISDSIAKFKLYGNAVAAIPCVEAVFISENGGSSVSCIPREKLLRTQTPQTYTLAKLLWAHEEAEKRGILNTAASCTLMCELGETVYFSAGSEKNIKLTTVDDIEIFKALLQSEKYEWLK